MKKTFIDKVIEERIVDTDKYRYIVDADGIKRLPIEWLGINLPSPSHHSGGRVLLRANTLLH